MLEQPKKPERIISRRTSVESGGLEFEQYGDKWGNYIIKVNGSEMAAGYECELIGAVFDELPEWLNLKDAKVTFEGKTAGEFISKAIIKDSRGAEWEIQRRIRPGQQKGMLIVKTQLKVNNDRDIVHIPWLTIFPGLGTFGERKHQGLFAGVEYLSDEPSSSTADIETPEHIRRVPEPVKITFPLMAVSHNGNYIGVIWEPSDMVAATFDSPDRIYNSDAHVMALSGPAVGELRFENDFCAHTPFKLKANKPLKVSILIIGGEGKTVIPAVKQYAALKGLPAVPRFEGGFETAVNLLAHGWLDSQINHDGLFRHAVWGNNFPPTPAADAAAFIDWLNNHCNDETLCERLNGAKYQTLRKIPSRQPFSSSVGHAHLPTAPFIFGRTYEFVQQRHRGVLGLLRNFDEDGIKIQDGIWSGFLKLQLCRGTKSLSANRLYCSINRPSFMPGQCRGERRHGRCRCILRIYWLLLIWLRLIHSATLFQDKKNISNRRGTGHGQVFHLCIFIRRQPVGLGCIQQ